ncbi:MAG: (2Fe-2S)-binding protein [Dehalococcoidia bacterium]|nr:(2Fe-2S)-binding protein [Dehalococcoidia bacterium]
MGDTITLKIDGQEVRARPGMTVLEAAREAGIEIPALCHHEKMTPYGACRICSVEAEMDGKTKIVASCGYPVEPGLVIRTRSPRVDRIRKTVIELVSPQANTDGDLGGDLKKLADEYGADIHRFEARLQSKSRRCTLCGLCVRYCDEVVGAHAIGFVGRGIDRHVVFFPDKASKVCASCQGCFKICPTGKIGAEADGTYFGFTIDDFLAGRL